MNCSRWLVLAPQEGEIGEKEKATYRYIVLLLIGTGSGARELTQMSRSMRIKIKRACSSWRPALLVSCMQYTRMLWLGA